MTQEAGFHTTMRPIPFSPPDIREEDIAAVTEVLRSGWITTGPRTAQFEAAISSMSGTVRSVAMSSATAALESALRLFNVGPGDEVIVPAYTYTASASVVHHVGARAVLVDSSGPTPHLAADAVAAALTPNTKAVIAVDLAGAPADYPAIYEALAASSVTFAANGELQAALGRPLVVADAAHSLGATALDGRPVGSLADLTCYSFHAVKNLTTAEGGAITWTGALFELADDELYRRLRRDSLHGQTKDALQKSKQGSWDYDIVEFGHKSNMTDIQAALGLSQLDRYRAAIARRHDILGRYAELLTGSGLELMAHPAGSSAHLALSFLTSWPDQRDRVIQNLADEGISLNVHYKPLPLLTAYRSVGWDAADFPNAVDFYRREITLPLHTLLSDDDVDRVGTRLRAEVTD